MPTHKGIKLSVISQWELQIHPEFAHPDSSQFTYRSPNLNHNPLLDGSPVSEASDSKADKVLGRPSTIAVYIPSASGVRFWVRYNIMEAAATISPWYFFKLFMNGRLITSWGVNSITKPNGQVMRGLFDPSERWNYRADGIVFKNNGTEARPFFFTEEDTDHSAAEDGGLIEVHVFRARGRRRRMPKPEEFRRQDKWGIVMPSGGLLDKPQDAKFYDWHLKDPKDKPFASFQFHYRSWDSLITQQLVPAEHARVLLPATPSLLSLNGLSRKMQDPPFGKPEESEVKVFVEEVEKDEQPTESDLKISVDELEEDEPRDSMSSNTSNTPWITSVFDDSPDHGARNPEKPVALFRSKSSFDHGVIDLGKPAALPGLKRTTSSYPLRFTNEMLVPTSKFSGAVPDSPPESPESLVSPPRCWGEIHQRPLPEIPSRSTSSSQGHHTRSSSTLSNAVSITPSLLSYYERNTASPEPIIGIATALPVVASTFGLNSDPEKKDRGSNSNEEADVDVRTDQTLEPSPAPARTPSKRPLGGVFSNVTLRKQRRRSSPTKHLSPIKQSPVLTSESSQLFDADKVADDKADDLDGEPSTLANDMTTLSLSESEWMCRTPSPVRDPDRDRVAQLWSPGVEKHSFRSSLEGNALRKKLAGLGEQYTEDIEDAVMARGDCEVKMRSGNWI